MVDKPDKPNPPTHEGMDLGKKVEPATMVSGAAGIKSGVGSDVANKDRSKDNSFKLPEKVSASEIKDQSYRYGGGRSAGGR